MQLDVGSETLLDEIGRFCRETHMAESTFGRLAVNDGKFVSRLRFGGHVTTRTLDRVHNFIETYDGQIRPRGPRRLEAETSMTPGAASAPTAMAAALSSAASAPRVAPVPKLAPAPESATSAKQNFRFYDNRQKYLLFVNTCGEKWAIAERVGMELLNVHPKPPALRLFDAGMGDGTVLTRVLRETHHRFPTMPLYIVGKEISLEDVRLSLEKMSDRFFEHPATVLVLTNLYYSEAPWLTPKTLAAAGALTWHEVVLSGTTAHDFDQQIRALQPFLAEHWNVRSSPTTGNPLYQRPTVLVIYRDDHKFLLDRVIPRRGATRADFDLVIASQPYRLRVPIEFKVRKVLQPLVQSLGPGGRMLAIHSHGRDPGLEIVQKLWPDENPFRHDRHQILRALKGELGAAGRDLNFNAYSDSRSIFTYRMHTLPEEISQAIGTSTLLAAWNAAIYVNQIEDERLAQAIKGTDYLDAVQTVLRKHGGLWFHDESYVVSRRRD
ncbi:MAG TPA: hypothetical protein VMF53_13580 [Alphaproteobacteria bacterium]|nr:hypothetical protein [Alphaproteobacteria bacterium]